MVFSAAVLSAAAGACALIDEKTKDCPEEMALTCALNLVNNKEQEMNDKLGTLHDHPLRAALEDYLSRVFTDEAHDVDLLFYDQRSRGKMTFRLTEVMDAEQKAFSIRVPASDYRIAGVSNRSAVPVLSLENEQDGYALSLVQRPSADAVPTHPAAVYAARQRVLVRDREDQTFDVHFHMANAVAALALNRDSCEVKSIRAVFTGLADTYRILDSAYTFDQHARLEANVIDASPYAGGDEADSDDGDGADGKDIREESERFLYDIFWERWTKLPLLVCGVGFPSPSVGSAVIGTFPIIWTVELYVTLADGSVTRNDIYIGKPLEASQLMIVKGWITANGSFTATPEHAPYVPLPEFPEDTVGSVVAGVDVMLNWTEMPTQYPDL